MGFWGPGGWLTSTIILQLLQGPIWPKSCMISASVTSRDRFPTYLKDRTEEYMWYTRQNHQQSISYLFHPQATGEMNTTGKRTEGLAGQKPVTKSKFIFFRRYSTTKQCWVTEGRQRSSPQHGSRDTDVHQWGTASQVCSFFSLSASAN